MGRSKRGRGGGNRNWEGGREGGRDRDGSWDRGRRRRRRACRESRGEVGEKGSNRRINSRVRGGETRGRSSHFRILVEAFKVAGLFGGLNMCRTVARRELGGWNKVSRGRSRGKGNDGRLEVESCGIVGGGTWSGDGLREDLKDFGPLARAHFEERRAWDRGRGGLDRDRRHRGAGLRPDRGIWTGGGRVGLTRGNKRGSSGERRGRDI